MLGLGRLRRLGRSLRLRWAPHGVILLYHRVADTKDDPQLLCISPRNFREHLEVIRERYRPLSLQELVRSLEACRLPERFVVITFDDGYADNLHNAKPLLAKAGVPATVFVSTGCLGGSQGFWWDELQGILLPPAAEGAVRWNVAEKTAPSARHELYRASCEKLRALPAADRRKALDDLRRQHGSGAGAESPCQVMSAEDVGALAKDGLVEIGAHTVNHPRLAALPLDEQRQEIVGSKVQLEAILGGPVRSFSYPFGGTDDYSAETVRLVSEAGFNCACANSPGVVTQGTGRFELPRFLVRDWSGEEFARRLAGWFHG
jgi:peptidoglycan/xylan/chitin deacetylase (PgdA/CDA1 family)